MKKTKILAIIGVLFAMGITACNKGGDQQSQSQDTQVTSKHTHNWGEYTETKKATCTEDGSKERVCSECGEKDVKTITKLGHDYSGAVISDTATCTTDGVKTVKCTRCDSTEEQFSAAHHTLGEATPVAAGEGTVAYNKYVCSKCQKIILEIELKESMITTGSNKNDPAGYIKLKSNNDVLEFAFDYSSNATGKMYQRGVMDAWSSNSSRNVFSGASQGGDDFELAVNGSKVDISSYKSAKYSEIMKGEAQEGNLSPLTDVESGVISLVNGKNTVKYTRKASYNLACTHFVFVIQDTTHEHQAGTEWKSDENQHWHDCVADECPIENYKMDAANHDWAADWAPVEGKAATCSQEGEESRTCKVCGYVATRKTAKTAHDFEALQAFPADAEKDAIATTAYKCKVCNEFTLRWSALDFDADDSKVTEIVKDGETPVGVKMKAADKLAPASQSAGTPDATVQGTLYVYKIDAYEAAEDVVLSFKIKPYNGYGNPDIFTTQNGDWTPGYVEKDGELVKSEYRYGLKVNNEVIELGKDPYGSDVKGKVAWYDFQAKFDVVKGLNTIEVLCLGGYPADAIYEYQLVGMPEFTPAHVHTLGDWKSDDAKHWKECSGDDCTVPAGTHLEEADHKFGEKYDVVEATCTAAGGYKEKCSICEYVKETVVPMKAHEFESEPVEETAAGEGYIASKAYNCKNCNESVLRWSSLDYDSTSTKVDKHTAYVRLNGCQYLNKNAEDLGSHLIYKVKASAATNVGLAFDIEANNGAPLFKAVSGDSSVGYEKDDEGNFIDQEVRYGLKVNGVKVTLGVGSSDNDDGSRKWASFIAKFDLVEGINTFDLYQFGGYRAKIYNFQITGLPHITPSHTHTLGAFQHDAINHWKECTGDDCTLAAGAHIGEDKHTFNAGTEQTDEAESKVQSCECGVNRIIWDARKFNAEGSKVGKPDTTDNGSTGITFSGDPYNKGGAEGVGDHALYKVNVPAAQTSAQLVMRFNRKDANKAFSAITGDAAPGYVLKDGEYVKADWRYKVLVNGVEVELIPYTAENPEPTSVAKTEVEFAFPCTFALNEGVNTIELQKYGGYTPVIVNLSLVY